MLCYIEFSFPSYPINKRRKNVHIIQSAVAGLLFLPHCPSHIPFHYFAAVRHTKHYKNLQLEIVFSVGSGWGFFWRLHLAPGRRPSLNRCAGCPPARAMPCTPRCPARTLPEGKCIRFNGGRKFSLLTTNLQRCGGRKTGTLFRQGSRNGLSATEARGNGKRRGVSRRKRTKNATIVARRPGKKSCFTTPFSRIPSRSREQIAGDFLHRNIVKKVLHAYTFCRDVCVCLCVFLVLVSL